MEYSSSSVRGLHSKKRNHYEVLGVSWRASEADIRDAYIDRSKKVINTCTAGMTVAALGAMPSINCLRKMSQRKRKAVGAAPAQVATAAELQVTEEQATYEPEPGVRERYLLFDSGVGDRHRILIFGRQSWLHVLSESRAIYMDGTFKVAPPLFKQVYVVLAARHDAVHPVLYCLLPNKSGDTYERLFARINELVPAMHPQSISLDYETAAFTAVARQWPMAQLFGCFFHLMHNMKKKVSAQQLNGRYDAEPNFALQARMVPCLAFVPIADIPEWLQVLKRYLPAELQFLATWLEESYIGMAPRQPRRGRDRPMFPMEMWNVYDRVLNDQKRTNNDAEAANRKINNDMQMAHPTIWRFLQQLKTIQKGRDLRYEALLRGDRAPIKLKKYIEADKRLKRIVLTYADRQSDEAKIEYLRGCAHNFKD